MMFSVTTSMIYRTKQRAYCRYTKFSKKKNCMVKDDNYDMIRRHYRINV